MSPAPATQQKSAAKKVPVWSYEAKTKNGETKKGEMEASDAEAVEQRLRQLGYQPVKVRKKMASMSFSLPGVGGVSQKDMVVFTRTFAVMIDSGLPLVQCLDILGNQSESPAMRNILLAVKTRVEGGSTFADALREHPKTFDELYTQLVAAGEIGGILDTILNRLAAYIEKNQKLVRKVKGAMTYPTIVVIVGGIVFAVLMLKVIPIFEKMFKDFGGTLPGPTQFVIDMSAWMQSNIFYIVGALVGIFFGFRAFLNNPKGRIMWDTFVLKTPIFGPLIRKVAVARFTRTLGTMVSSGVPILDALDVVAKTAGNKVIEAGIQHVRTKISEGKTIAAPLLETGVFPPMVVQMIGVGEATGAMDQMLNKIADFYDDEVDVAVDALTSALEPIIMVFMGGGAGGFIVAMYLPIFSLAGAIK
ncbi:MAG TPA: type II secretion system F family protein [Myxococcales bacterium]|jgi:type IV pilus assembly protein PilC